MNSKRSWSLLWKIYITFEETEIEKLSQHWESQFSLGFTWEVMNSAGLVLWYRALNKYIHIYITLKKSLRKFFNFKLKEVTDFEFSFWFLYHYFNIQYNHLRVWAQESRLIKKPREFFIFFINHTPFIENIKHLQSHNTNQIQFD